MMDLATFPIRSSLLPPLYSKLSPSLLSFHRRSIQPGKAFHTYNHTHLSPSILSSLNTRQDLGAPDVQNPNGGELFTVEGILSDAEFSRLEALKRVDEELAQANERKALAIVLALQGRPDGLRGFGAASQVPQRLYTLEDLRLNKIETTRFLSPVDTTLGGVRRNLQLAAVFGGIVAWQTLGLNQYQLLSILLALTVLSGIDLVRIAAFWCYKSNHV